MSDNTKVTIIVDGLGKQEILLNRKSATDIYVAASQGIIDKLLTKDKPEHSCSCGGSCHSEAEKEIALSNEESTLLVGYADKGPINTPVNLNETGQSIREFMENHNVNSERVRKSNIDLEEVGEKPYPFSHEMWTKPKLVAYRCPDCGRVTVRNIILADGNEARCHWCKETAIIERVTLAHIQCTSCGQPGHLYVANGLTELDCIKCKAPIDIIHYKDGNKDCAKSANLMD